MTAGQVVFLYFAGDNTATVDGNDGLVSSVQDSSGTNTWTVDRCNTNSNAAAGAGATVCLAHSVLGTTLTSGSSTITANFSSITAKAMGAVAFTCSASCTVASTGTPQDERVDAGDAGSLTLGGLASAEHLWIHVTAIESATSGHSSASWASCTINGFSTDANSGGGGGDATKMATGNAWCVKTATTLTNDPVLTITTADNASILMAFDETAGGGGGGTTHPGWYGPSGWF